VEAFGSPTPVSAVTEDQDIADLIETVSTDDFDPDFYEVLPDIEQVMPDDLPEATASRPKPNVDYFLQAASFREHADAEKLRARLALKGYKSVTQARDVDGKGRFFRVRLGPYADKRKAKTAKQRLQRLGVRPFVYTVKKTEGWHFLSKPSLAKHSLIYLGRYVGQPLVQFLGIKRV